MNISGIIFDLDMTLVDTSLLISFRQNRQWRKVYANIPDTKIYTGIIDLLIDLKSMYKVGIVTSSPRKYANKIIINHSIDIPILVAYHDTDFHKPSPEPILFGCHKLDCKPSEVISIGDDINDIIASNSAGATSVLVSWENSIPNSSHANFSCTTVADLKQYIKNK
ncbi:MAG: HAD-IIIA family hydrolase [Candidatus Scalindua sp.]|jgi:HAD superfamily hydrolase (TIGR01662 family)|nr:HAD-IIIA family hydrolase [Candidatus Scalindua sp.]